MIVDQKKAFSVLAPWLTGKHVLLASTPGKRICGQSDRGEAGQGSEKSTTNGEMIENGDGGGDRGKMDGLT